MVKNACAFLMCVSTLAFAKSDHILHLDHQMTGHNQVVLESYVKFVIIAARTRDIEIAEW